MRLLRDQSGFTLVEAIIAAGLTGILGLGIGATVTLSTNVRMNVNAITDTQTLEALLRTQLSKPQVCQQVLAAKGSVAQPLGTVVNATTGQIPYTVYRYNPNLSAAPQILFVPGPPAAGQNEFNSIIVNSSNVEFYTRTNPAGSPQIQAMGALRLQIRKKGSILGSGTLYTITIPVNFVVSNTAPARLQACAAVSSEFAIPQCAAGTHLQLQVQSVANPSPTAWVCVP